MNCSKRAPATQMINGEECSVYFNPTCYQQSLEFEPEEGDVIEVAFPRSGTHLVQQMIQLILNRGRSTRTFVEFSKRAPFLEIQGLQETVAPRLLRTHLPINRLRFSGKAKYVYVARNPWDCCVSNFHIMKDFPRYQFTDGSFDDFLDAFLEGRFGFGDYFDHVISGFRRRHDENVFFVTYEEIHKNKAAVILKLAHFLDEGYGEMVQRQSDLLERIVENSSFDFMRNILQTNEKEIAREFRKGAIPNNLCAEERDPTKNANYSLIRKGCVGGWRSYFSRDNIKRMQDKIDEKFRDADIRSLWIDEECSNML